MKTFNILFSVIILIIVSSCNKDELEFSPAESELQKTDFKGELKNLPPKEENCFYLREGTTSNALVTHSGATVNFQGKIWAVVLNTETAYKHRAGTSEIWSSYNGKRWILRKSNPFSGKKNASMVVHNNRLWVLGGRDGYNRYLRDIWSSANGIDWRLEALAPFNLGSRTHTTFNQVTTFQNKIYVFTKWYRNREIIVYSSSDGKRWNLETSNLFGTEESPSTFIFETVVYNNALYAIGLGGEGYPVIEIFRTTNGRNWNRVDYDSSPLTNDFEQQFGLARYGTVTRYKGLVWYIGGARLYWLSPRIWYTSDMQTWTEYQPRRKSGSFVLNVDGPQVYSHSAIPFNDELLIFGGYNGDPLNPHLYFNHKVWSLYEDCIEESK